MTADISDDRRLAISLPVQWSTHSRETWQDIAADAPLNPALRLVAGELGDHLVAPSLIASLHHEVRIADDGSRVVLLASVVVFVMPCDGHVSNVPIEGHIRRRVPIVNDIKADFLQLPVVIADETAGLVALATFTTPNLPLATQMIDGFTAIARSIRFLPSSTSDAQAAR